MSEVKLFSDARRFLAESGYAKNVRVADVVAVVRMPAGAQGPGASDYWGEYGGGAGADPGPLDREGNMPRTAAGFVVGSSVVYAGDVATDTSLNTHDTLQSLQAFTSQVIRVGGTDVVTRHGAFSAFTPAQGMSPGDADGPMLGRPYTRPRQAEPLLYVGGGERIGQALRVRESGVSTLSSAIVQLIVTMVLAEQGTD